MSRDVTREPYEGPCPVCEEGALSARTWAGEFIAGLEGRTVRVEGLERYECDACAATPMLPPQIQRNHRRIQAARNRSA